MSAEYPRSEQSSNGFRMPPDISPALFRNNPPGELQAKAEAYARELFCDGNGFLVLASDSYLYHKEGSGVEGMDRYHAYLKRTCQVGGLIVACWEEHGIELPKIGAFEGREIPDEQVDLVIDKMSKQTPTIRSLVLSMTDSFSVSERGRLEPFAKLMISLRKSS